MAGVRKAMSFGLGGLIGAGVGAAAGLLLAPSSGDEFRGQVRQRVDDAKEAGAEAEAATQRELVARFQLTVDDPTALRDQLS